MIIQDDYLGKIHAKFFKETVCLINIVKTESELGIVCYNFPNSNVWQPFFYSFANQKVKINAKYENLNKYLPNIDKNNVLEAKSKFYTTFDTPIEVQDSPIKSFIIYDKKNKLIERKTYYLIIDVQELERSFNSNILPCIIIDLNKINEQYKNLTVDESVKLLLNINNN